jgi:hypothetical protein
MRKLPLLGSLGIMEIEQEKAEAKPQYEIALVRSGYVVKKGSLIIATGLSNQAEAEVWIKDRLAGKH